MIKIVMKIAPEINRAYARRVVSKEKSCSNFNPQISQICADVKSHPGANIIVIKCVHTPCYFRTLLCKAQNNY